VDGTLADFTYDFQGQRVRKRVTAGGVTRETLYSDGIYERRDGQVLVWVLLKDRRMAAIDAGVTVHLHHDHLGSIVLTTDGVGQIVQQLVYRAFGAVAASTGPAATAAFLGNEADAEIGLVYCQSRYYHPRLGRFISPDLLLLHEPEKAVEMPGSLNLYVYAANNPVKLVDPDGAWWKWLVGGLIIAALVIATIAVGVVTGGAGFAFGILLLASIGSALGAGVGTYSAWRAGGNLDDGFLVGAIVGGAAGAAGYAAGAAVGAAASGLGGAWGLVLSGAAQGAIIGGANGALVGYGGGTGSWQDVLIHAGIGALAGAVLGGISGYVSYISNQGGALQAGTFERTLSTGTAEGTSAYGQPIQQTYQTGLAPVGQALDQGFRATLNTIIRETAHPMVYAGLGSVTHAVVARDWDSIKTWILDTFGGEEREVIVNAPEQEF
jgi:RHS repeat-associated protein